MTTMFNSLYCHIISRCTTYNSRPPPPPAGPLMFALCFGSKDVKIYTLLCNKMLLLLGLTLAVTTADAPWLLLTAIWHFTSVCWALIVTLLIIKYDFHRVLSLHHLNPASLLLQHFNSTPVGPPPPQLLLTGNHTVLCAALLSDVAYTHCFHWEWQQYRTVRPTEDKTIPRMPGVLLFSPVGVAWLNGLATSNLLLAVWRARGELWHPYSLPPSLQLRGREEPRQPAIILTSQSPRARINSILFSYLSCSLDESKTWVKRSVFFLDKKVKKE